VSENTQSQKKGSVTELPGLPSSTHCGHTATLTTIYGSTQIGVCMRSLKNLLTSSSDRTSCMPLSLSITSGKSLMVTRSAPGRPLCRDELHHSKRIRGDNVNDRVRSCSWVNWLCSTGSETRTPKKLAIASQFAEYYHKINSFFSHMSECPPRHKGSDCYASSHFV
jgi:hypothetical protein